MFEAGLKEAGEKGRKESSIKRLQGGNLYE
jgi:hypothetical protein